MRTSPQLALLLPLLAIACAAAAPASPAAAAALPPLTISASAPRVSQSALVNISWTGANPDSHNDWIVFWQAGADPTTDKKFVAQSWRYVYGGQSILPSNASTSAPINGTIAVTAPSRPGTYKVYYCLSNGYQCPASVQVEVVNATVPRVSCSRAGKSRVKHLVIIQTENHSFDSTFGAYCKAKPGSWPMSSYGPNACEAPPKLVSGVAPTALTNAENSAYDPDHTSAQETCFWNQGRMDQYVAGTCVKSDPRNFAVMDTSSSGDAAFYGKLARSTAFTNMNSAIADRFFQPALGASCENDMFTALPYYLYRDNEIVAQNCSLPGMSCYCTPWNYPADAFQSFYAPTVFDLLNQCNVTWAAYAQGYAAAPGPNQCYGSFFDATDFAQSFFPSLTKAGSNQWRDATQFQVDVERGTLPTVSHVRSLGNASEHPGWGITPSTDFLASITGAIDRSPLYNHNTLIIVMPDESGGFYDHVQPPTAPNAIDGVFYGARLGAIAIGSMVHKPSREGGFVSHQFMETSSIVKFIEWNWLNGNTGVLGGRDATVSNLGDFLDTGSSGTKVPVF